MNNKGVLGLDYEFSSCFPVTKMGGSHCFDGIKPTVFVFSPDNIFEYGDTQAGKEITFPLDTSKIL